MTLSIINTGKFQQSIFSIEGLRMKMEQQI